MRWHVTVSFYNAVGEEESTYLDIETAEDDAQETAWELLKEEIAKEVQPQTDN